MPVLSPASGPLYLPRPPGGHRDNVTAPLCPGGVVVRLGEAGGMRMSYCICLGPAFSFVTCFAFTPSGD